jgi:hypothetical protein
MELTNVGIIYSKAQKVRREVIVGGDDPTYRVHKDRLLPGEGWLDCPVEVYQSFTDPNAIDAFLALAIGEATSDSCVVIDNTDKILAVCCADPVIDDHPLGVIIQDDPAQVGDSYDFVNQTVIPDPVRLAAEAAALAEAVAYALAHPITEVTP